MICKIWHVTLKRHWLPWMGQIVPYWREARTQTVELAVTVKVGSFEPGGLGQEGDGGWRELGDLSSSASHREICLPLCSLSGFPVS